MPASSTKNRKELQLKTCHYPGNYKLCSPQSAYSEWSLNQEDFFFFFLIKRNQIKSRGICTPDMTASVLEGIHPSHLQWEVLAVGRQLITWSWKSPTASQTAHKEHSCGTTRSHTQKIHKDLLRVLSIAWREELRALICPSAVCSQWE